MGSGPGVPLVRAIQIALDETPGALREDDRVALHPLAHNHGELLDEFASVRASLTRMGSDDTTDL
jgi:hypothetical protein